ncbi:hypothetical protein L6164_022092 [Bauhinia variegata]|uniref:Uncharacterized protein n=1 Tax=Bauhinia variegata TaxID=167791 RepID=A0ACB9ME44_BAUVA|nr:hypothetical protein L6164_022092 [Bauhinia variegata]
MWLSTYYAYKLGNSNDLDLFLTITIIKNALIILASHQIPSNQKFERKPFLCYRPRRFPVAWLHFGDFTFWFWVLDRGFVLDLLILLPDLDQWMLHFEINKGILVGQSKLRRTMTEEKDGGCILRFQTSVIFTLCDSSLEMG